MANYHITSIEDTLANFFTDSEHGQRAVLTNNGDTWAWKDDGGTKVYLAAPQGYTTNGSTFAAYSDVHFGEVTLHDDLLLSEYIKRSGGTDDYIRLQDNTCTIALTGTTAIAATNTAVTILGGFSFSSTTLTVPDAGTIWLGTGKATITFNDEATDDITFTNCNVGIGVTPINFVDIQKDQNAGTFCQIKNNTGGTGAYAGLVVASNSCSGGLYAIDDGYSDAEFADKVTLQTASTTAALALYATAAAGEIQFYTGGVAAANKRMTITSGGYVGIGTATVDRLLHVEATTATTNAVQYLQRLTETCSGTVAAGFGVGHEYELEGMDGTNYVAGTAAVYWTSTEGSIGNAVYRLQLYTDGTGLETALTIYNDGDTEFYGDVYINGNVLRMDADDDTYLYCASDDVLSVYIAGNADFSFSANSLNILSGSAITMADDTWIGNDAAGGRIVFDSTPATDAIKFLDCDVYSEAWTDYSASSTVTGFTGTPTKYVYYKRFGKMILCQFSITGTSNATSFTFTLPANAAIVSLLGVGSGEDNGADSSGCMFITTGSGGTINVIKGIDYNNIGIGTANWTNSGVKSCAGSFVYESI